MSCLKALHDWEFTLPQKSSFDKKQENELVAQRLNEELNASGLADMLAVRHLPPAATLNDPPPNSENTSDVAASLLSRVESLLDGHSKHLKDLEALIKERLD